MHVRFRSASGFHCQQQSNCVRTAAVICFKTNVLIYHNRNVDHELLYNSMNAKIENRDRNSSKIFSTNFVTEDHSGETLRSTHCQPVMEGFFMPRQLFLNKRPIVLPLFSTLLHTGDLRHNLHVFQCGNNCNIDGFEGQLDMK